MNYAALVSSKVVLHESQHTTVWCPIIVRRGK